MAGPAPQESFGRRAFKNGIRVTVRVGVVAVATAGCEAITPPAYSADNRQSRTPAITRQVGPDIQDGYGVTSDKGQDNSIRKDSGHPGGRHGAVLSRNHRTDGNPNTLIATDSGDNNDHFAQNAFIPRGTRGKDGPNTEAITIFRNTPGPNAAGTEFLNIKSRANGIVDTLGHSDYPPQELLLTATDFGKDTVSFLTKLASDWGLGGHGSTADSFPFPDEDERKIAKTPTPNPNQFSDEDLVANYRTTAFKTENPHFIEFQKRLGQVIVSQLNKDPRRFTWDFPLTKQTLSAINSLYDADKTNDIMPPSIVRDNDTGEIYLPAFDKNNLQLVSSAEGATWYVSNSPQIDAIILAPLTKSITGKDNVQAIYAERVGGFINPELIPASRNIASDLRVIEPALRQFAQEAIGEYTVDGKPPAIIYVPIVNGEVPFRVFAQVITKGNSKNAAYLIGDDISPVKIPEDTPGKRWVITSEGSIIEQLEGRGPNIGEWFETGREIDLVTGQIITVADTNGEITPSVTPQNDIGETPVPPTEPSAAPTDVPATNTPEAAVTEWWNSDNPEVRYIGLAAKLALEDLEATENSSLTTYYIGWNKEDLKQLKIHMKILKYMQNSHDTSFFPWFESPFSLSNPLKFVAQRVTNIRNNEGKGTNNNRGINLDKNLFNNQDYSQETQWYLTVAGFMKEVVYIEWAKQSPETYDATGSYSDLGSVVAEIFTVQDMLLAKDDNGNFVISNPRVRSELQDFIDRRIGQINNTAKEKGWWKEISQKDH